MLLTVAVMFVLMLFTVSMVNMKQVTEIHSERLTLIYKETHVE